jgi:hypothetical protein
MVAKSIIFLTKNYLVTAYISCVRPCAYSSAHSGSSALILFDTDVLIIRFDTKVEKPFVNIFWHIIPILKAFVLTTTRHSVQECNKKLFFWVKNMFF